MEASGDSELLDCWWETINTSYDGSYNNIALCCIKLYLVRKSKYYIHFLDEVDELDSSLTLTCTMIDLICELLAGIASNNTLQQEAVVRWTKLLFGNISEPILQVRFMSERILHLFHKLFVNFKLIYRK